MKNIVNFIQEKLQINQDSKIKEKNEVKFLSDLLIKYVLKNQNIKKDDFIDWDNKYFTLYNVPQDRKYFLNFYNQFENDKDNFILEGDPFKTPYPDTWLTIKSKKDKNTFIIFNFNDITDSNHKIKKGDIVSLDISTNIKDYILHEAVK